MVMVGGALCNHRAENLNSYTGPLPMRSSSATTVVTLFHHIICCTDLKRASSMCTQTTVLRVLSDFLNRKVDLRGATASSPALQS